MQELLTAAAATTTAIYLIVFANWHNMLRINFKPFNCALCLSVWVYILFSFLPSYVALNSLYACLAGCSAAIIQKILTKWQ
jgi:hypothetical protein